MYGYRRSVESLVTNIFNMTEPPQGIVSLPAICRPPTYDEIPGAVGGAKEYPFGYETLAPSNFYNILGDVAPVPPAKEDKPPSTAAPGKPKPMPKPKSKPPSIPTDSGYLVAEEDSANPPTSAQEKPQTLPKPPRKSTDNDYRAYLRISPRQSSPN